jgi:ABC-type multidrug transport system permease subunit
MIHVASAIAFRVIKKSLTNISFLLPALMFPVIFFVGYAGALSGIDQIPGFDYAPGYETFQFAFVMVQSAAMAGVFTGFGIAQDFERGFARRLMIAAPRRSGILVGYAIATMVRWFMNTLVVLAIGLLIGMEILGDGLDLFALLLLGLTVNLIGTLWAAGVALRLRSTQAGPIMQFPIFLVIFLAPVFVPIELLTGWIHTVASINPFTAFIEGARSLLAGSTEEVAIAFGIAVPLAALFGFWALTGMRSAERG